MSSSMPNKSRSVLRYCATVSRRAPPFFGRARVRAICSAPSIHATNAARSALLGCASSSGGISSSNNCFRIISQCRTSLSGTVPSK